MRLAGLFMLIALVTAAAAVGATTLHGTHIRASAFGARVSGYGRDSSSPVMAQARGFSRQFNGDQIRLTAPGEPVREGAHALRVELDRHGRNVPGPRAELSADAVLSGERWYGFSTYLDPSWATDPAPDIVTQWHGVGRLGSDNSPSLSLGTQNGQWMIDRNPDAHYMDTPIGRYRTGTWVDWVVHVRWTAARTGFLTVWQNGRKVMDLHGVQTGYSGDPGTYLKMGIYKWPWDRERGSTTTRRIVYLDDERIAGAAGSYRAVAP